ncbi:hypothetical protein PMI05_04018 [Brevibacillus sp. BC25]|nr:hypothetical protein PMI05_04018 [Brevibacillus sp. BC25]
MSSLFRRFRQVYRRTVFYYIESITQKVVRPLRITQAFFTAYKPS